MKTLKHFLIAAITIASLIVLVFLGNRYLFPHKVSLNVSRSAVIIDTNTEKVVQQSNIELKGELTYSWFSTLKKYQGVLTISNIPLTYDSSYSLGIAHFFEDNAILNYSMSLAPQNTVTLGVLKCSPRFERFSIRLARQDGSSSNYYLIPLEEGSSYADAILILKSMWPIS